MNPAFGLSATLGQLTPDGTHSAMGTSTLLETGPTKPTAAATFDGLLASVSREILRDAPEFDVAKSEDAQRFLSGQDAGFQAENDLVDPAALQEFAPIDRLQDASPMVARNNPTLDRGLVFAAPQHDGLESIASPQAAGTSFTAPDEWSDALLELNDARHVFVPSLQSVTLHSPNPPKPLPQSTQRRDVASFTSEASPTMALESGEVRSPPVDLIDTDSVVLPKIVGVQQTLAGVSTHDFVLEEAGVDDVGDVPKSESEPKTATRPAMTRVDPVQLRAADAIAASEPGLVSVDTHDTVDNTVAVTLQGPAETPELPVAPVQLDTVRVELDPDLAVEVRTVDGEVDVSLLGSEAVKPVMKGVQAELRESLKRGGYDLGRFDRSEQQDAGRRQRRRQQQHQQRRDTRRGALL